jgi:ABC-type glutathione transport system ATPase component
VVLDGQDLSELKHRELRLLRRRMQMIFQDPYASLNPRMTILECVQEPLIIHKEGSGAAQQRRARELLDIVGIASHNHSKRPRSFSGGQLQRVGIARALALNPELIVCDEPVSALDVSIQAQVLNLLKDLQQEFMLTYLFISHDLAVVRQMCDNVCVMKDGEIVESGTTTHILESPEHEYTQALLSAVVKTHLD